MSAPNWNAEHLGALADEWTAEREAFLSGVHAYLATQLPQSVATRQPIAPHDYAAELAAIGARLHRFLQVMDQTVWYTLQRGLGDFQRQLAAEFDAPARVDAQWLAQVAPPATAHAAHVAVQQALALLQHILDVYDALHGQFDFATVRYGWRVVSQIKYRLYPVRLALPALQRYWLLDDADLGACEPPGEQTDPAAGVRRFAVDKYRGAYTAYIPEYYRPDRQWPLIVALHGASGNDEDFLWTWLKYAKSRGYLLLSGKSFGSTWHAWDAPSVLLMLDDMLARYAVDPHRILLTGLSDGGSFSYEVGFAFPERFAGLAVVAGILRPHQRSPQASRLPVYIAHGERDQLFPAPFIRLVAEKLRGWGHRVTYHELPGFGHAYPAGENTAILDWFAAHAGPASATAPAEGA
jgi:phospholipase/carboxylesterase